jgi:hypothetical protein
MRKVVDSNYLGTKELRDYLAASPENEAVIADYAEMEMFKAETLEGLLKSTEILAQYPEQALLAKTTDIATNLRGRKKGLKKRLTDKKRTRVFRNWCRRREQIQGGDPAFEEERKRARAEAIAHLDHMLENLKGLKDDLDAHAAQHYTEDELTILRTRKPLTPALQDKLIDGIMDFALKLFAANPARAAVGGGAALYLHLPLCTVRLFTCAALDRGRRSQGSKARKVSQRHCRCRGRRLRDVLRRLAFKRQTSERNLRQRDVSSDEPASWYSRPLPCSLLMVFHFSERTRVSEATASAIFGARSVSAVSAFLMINPGLRGG